MIDSHAIDQLEIAHARFNALKTVSTATPSEFETRSFGTLTATRDRQRDDSYYNRILGFRPGADSDLQAAIEWISAADGASSEIRTDVIEGTDANGSLRDAGFGLEDRLVWLARAPRDPVLPNPGAPAPMASAPADGVEHEQVCELSTNDWPALRLVLERQGEITNAIWRQKRHHLCTDTFRWFGIFDAESLVSVASLWLGPQAAILGSAYTLMSRRGRGHQQTLLEARKAAWPGVLLVDVEPDSTSYRNCERTGFAEHERREIWTLKP